jgi:hypothetical protein
MRQRALATGTIQTLVIDADNGRYTANNYTEKLVPHVAFGIMPGVQGPPSHPTTSLTNAVTFKDSTITFYPDGILGSGTVYMTDKDGSVLYALSSGVGHTSYIRMYKYCDSWELIE